MKILIVSDSHGRNSNIEKVLKKVTPLDLFIHLGDLETNSDFLEAVIPCPCEMVSGNNDYFTNLPREKVITIGKYKVLLTHGHQYGVNFDNRRIKEIGRAQGMDIVLYGHTHIPCIDLSDSVWAVNPGSISLPRQEGYNPSFIIMDIDREGKAHFTINYI